MYMYILIYMHILKIDADGVPRGPVPPPEPIPALETTHGQNNRSFRQLPQKCYLEKVSSVGD